MDKLSAVGRLFAEAVFLIGELRRQRLAEISGLEHRADFDLARAWHRIGAALHPRALGHVLDLPEPEAGDQLAGLGKGAVNGAARAVKGHALALGWVQALAGQQMPALTRSSLYWPMAARSSVEGMTPASRSFVAFTRTMTHIDTPSIHTAAPSALLMRRTSLGEIDIPPNVLREV